MAGEENLNLGPRRGGGRPVYGASLGIIILDMRFQRFPGDIGYAGTFDFPVQYAIAHGMKLGANLKPDEKTLEVFFRAVDELVKLGVDGISTSCGFLSIMQPHLQARSPVPVASSSLMQIPLVQRTLPTGKKVGVLTAEKEALTAAHFEGVGASFDLPIEGMPADSSFRQNMVIGNPRIDRAQQEREVLQRAELLVRNNPDLGAIVLECTNLSPYSDKIEAAFGLPVYDIITLLRWFHSGLRPKTYSR